MWRTWSTWGWPPRNGRGWLCSGSRARSSVGERSLHTREVAGSKPAAPIIRRARDCGLYPVKGCRLVSIDQEHAPAGLLERPLKSSCHSGVN